VGEVAAVGPDAAKGPNGGAKVGDKAVVYPWIGCGKCWYCTSGSEHLCPTPRALGVNQDGGYADHVLVPHAKYLYPYGNLPVELACLYACSGITAFGAVKKAVGHDAGKPILVIGAGGVGLMGVRFAKAVLGREPIVADIDENKRQLALKNGASAVVDPRDKEARKKIMDLTGGTGVAAAIDFVGAEASAQFGWRALGRGGRLIVVGLFGGTFSTPLPMFAFTGAAFMGSVTGTPAEMAEMMALVRDGKVSPVPVTTRGLDDANDALQDLRKGLIMGRAVLVP
jgi:D-arabinose 1-dehydrogenase-like Zn-dependent alcohol dehydrogenase